MFTPAEAIGKQPIFLIIIDFMGITYHFAQQKISISGKSFDGDLRDFDYSQKSSLLGIDIESNSVSCAVVFDTIDLVKQWRKGNTLDGCTAELSYVLEDNGNIVTTYDNRVVLFKGLINQPVIGDRQEPRGFASFTIEQAPYDFSNTLLNPSLIISTETFPNHDPETAGGKAYPFVFGQPGKPRNASGVTVDTYCTPAYMSQKQAGNFHFLIAAHPVQATQVKIKDQAGNIATFAVVESIDGNGNPYSYVDVTGSALVYPGKLLTAGTENAAVSEWWVLWDNGGGFKNPFGDGSLTKAGDICRYVLLLSKQETDFGAWGNIANVINGYEFAGYVNDLEVSAWDWLTGNILPYLPIEVQSGPKGIKPILALIFSSTYLQASDKIIASREFYQTGAITTAEQIGELINKVTIRFAKNGLDQDYSMIARIGDIDEDNQEQRKDIYSLVSTNKFGILEQTIETDYLYDRDVAFLIAHTIVKAKSFPIIQIDYVADAYLGHYRVGDLLQITDDNIYLNADYCTVLAKQWTGLDWSYTIGIQDNAIALSRYHD